MRNQREIITYHIWKYISNALSEKCMANMKNSIDNVSRAYRHVDMKYKTLVGERKANCNPFYARKMKRVARK